MDVKLKDLMKEELVNGEGNQKSGDALRVSASMEKAFVNFLWKNTPSIDSPINASNLNAINNGLDTVDNRVIQLNSNKADKSDFLQSLKTVSYAPTTGIWTFTYNNGTTVTVDQNVEKIPVSFSLSPQGILTMTTADGTQFTCDISTLIKTYTFNDSTDIDFTVTTGETGNKTIVANLVDGSVTASKLQPNYLADVTTQAQNASGSANSALGSANSAAADALLAQSYAVGNSGVRTGENTDNSKYYKEQAALNGEAWTRGTRGGVPVPSSDETYLNNSKYYSDLADEYQQQAKEYRDQAQQIVGIGIATSSAPGIVMPDDDTISIDPSTGLIAFEGITDTEYVAISALFN